MVISEETIKARNLFSQRLSACLSEHNIKQNELADYLNVSESTVGKWVLGKSMPRTMGIIQQLADKFQVGKSYFLEEDALEETSKETTILMRAQNELDEDELNQLENMAKFFLDKKKNNE